MKQHTQDFSALSFRRPPSLEQHGFYIIKQICRCISINTLKKTLPATKQCQFTV